MLASLAKRVASFGPETASYATGLYFFVMAGQKARSAVFAPEVPAIPLRDALPY